MLMTCCRSQCDPQCTAIIPGQVKVHGLMINSLSLLTDSSVMSSQSEVVNEIANHINAYRVGMYCRRLSVCLSVCVCLYLCLCVCLFVCLSVHLSFCISVRLSVFLLSVSLSLFISVNLSVCL